MDRVKLAKLNGSLNVRRNPIVKGGNRTEMNEQSSKRLSEWDLAEMSERGKPDWSEWSEAKLMNARRIKYNPITDPFSGLLQLLLSSRSLHCFAFSWILVRQWVVCALREGDPEILKWLFLESEWGERNSPTLHDHQSKRKFDRIENEGKRSEAKQSRSERVDSNRERVLLSFQIESTGYGIGEPLSWVSEWARLSNLKSELDFEFNQE